MRQSPCRNDRCKDFEIAINGRLAARRIEPLGPPPDSKAPVLVFLHEGLGSTLLWGDFPQLLATSCGLPALLYDRLGHGWSDPLPSAGLDIGYLEPEAELFLPAVLAACDVRNPIFIGHSDGGTIALLYAAGFGRHALGIVTEAAHVIVEDRTREGIRQVAETYRTTDLKARLAKYHGDKVDGLFRRWTETWLSDDFAPWDIRGRLQPVHCPVLAIQGEDDEFGTAAQVYGIADNVSGPAEIFLVPGCRHVPHYQAREAVAERIVTFINALMSPGH